MHPISNENSKRDWGYHINRSKYSQTCPPIPVWAKSRMHDWSDRGLVIWDEGLRSVTHLRASYAAELLTMMNKNQSWRNDGIIVGDRAYEMIVESSKSQITKKAANERKDKPLGKWVLTDKIELSPVRAQEMFTYLTSHEEILHGLVADEEKDVKRVLADAYGFLLRLAETKKQE
jgi:hypothetical protein